MTAPTAGRTLTEHIEDALLAQTRRILAGVVDDEHGRAVREQLAQWYETIEERLSIELRVELTRSGRKDTRSTFAIVWLSTSLGVVELCRVRVRDLVDAHGRPVDPRATARDLLAQAQPAPDHVPTEWLTEGGTGA
ncbi:hypothetical protein [Pseudonocardia hydrocarbonoxydans]|uniref:Uncharacterized protein n=1 Tax=Pseudonocardia hydrocarbonoxydans TaxID=76726 RepID=A0A4Y3WPR4_9PSEU|nr:hypothetical protein [Pseudonocardia hydrocarbonoxydans]GEC20815.1 hypothetical protein PHY01_30980 [Pseudonocardia hydrocarbonoxydans]